MNYVILKLQIFSLLALVGCMGGCCLLEIDLVNFYFSVDELININHYAEAIDVHEDKAWIDIISNATVGTCRRTGVYNDTSLMLVGLELMRVASDEDVHIQLPLKHC